MLPKTAAHYFEAIAETSIPVLPALIQAVRGFVDFNIVRGCEIFIIKRLRGFIVKRLRDFLS